MSTHISHFVIYGLVLPYPADDDLHDRIEPYDAREPGSGEGRVVVIADGMSAAYMVVGHCLRHGGEAEGIPMTSIPVPVMTSVYADILMQQHNWKTEIEGVLETLGLLDGIAAKGGANLGWHIFTHFR